MKDAPRRDGGAARAPRNAPLRTPVHPWEHARAALNARVGQGSSGFLGQDVHNPPIREFTPRLRPECAPITLPQDAPCALDLRGGSGNGPGKTGSIFGQVGEAWAGSRTLRTGSAERSADAQSGRRSSPPGPVRRPRGCRRRCPPAHWIQYSGPTHAGSMEALPPWPEKSARTGARPHNGSTTQLRVSDPYFSTDHNPAIRNNAS